MQLHHHTYSRLAKFQLPGLRGKVALWCNYFYAIRWQNFVSEQHLLLKLSSQSHLDVRISVTKLSCNSVMLNTSLTCPYRKYSCIYYKKKQPIATTLPLYELLEYLNGRCVHVCVCINTCVWRVVTYLYTDGCLCTTHSQAGMAAHHHRNRTRKFTPALFIPWFIVFHIDVLTSTPDQVSNKKPVTLW